MDRTVKNMDFVELAASPEVPGLFCGWLMLSVMRGEWICLI